MTHQIVVHFQSSISAAQASAASIIHAQMGGILVTLNTPAASDEGVDGTHSAAKEQTLEERYCYLMAAPRGGIIDVTRDQAKAMTEFIALRRAVLSELKTVIVSTSPDAESQSNAVETLAAILAGGVDRSSIGILLVDAPANTQDGGHYAAVFSFAREAQITVSHEAMLPVAAPFPKIQQLKMPIAAVLNRAVNFETDLTAARLNGAPEKVVQALAHKVLAQRDLLETTGALQRVADVLGLPRISQEEWRAELAPVINRKRTKAITPH